MGVGGSGGHSYTVSSEHMAGWKRGISLGSGCGDTHRAPVPTPAPCRDPEDRAQRIKGARDEGFSWGSGPKTQAAVTRPRQTVELLLLRLEATGSPVIWAGWPVPCPAWRRTAGVTARPRQACLVRGSAPRQPPAEVPKTREASP